mmetsp:Transcript_1819/g.2616  ORF Transcript_1819/g.2616 Transcript_1819/m.2616 type:complete len:87 (+) Transcript_1819:375-635(+)
MLRVVYRKSFDCHGTCYRCQRRPTSLVRGLDWVELEWLQKLSNRGRKVHHMAECDIFNSDDMHSSLVDYSSVNICMRWNHVGILSF